MSRSRSIGRISFGDRRLNDACLALKHRQLDRVPTHSAPTERITHPTIAAPSFKCYRVVRLVKGAADTVTEDIGAFTGERAFGNALSLASRELGYAVIIDPSGKQVSYNGQPMTQRLREEL